MLGLAICLNVFKKAFKCAIASFITLSCSLHTVQRMLWLQKLLKMSDCLKFLDEA